jgi:two-component system NarL family sensor kinase
VTLEQGGFELALGAVARQAARQGDFEIEIDLDPDLVAVHDELFLAVARELLTNAARHADAGRVSVSLKPAGDAVELEVADDGRGMEPGRRERALAEGHIGLASVAQRVQSESGEFHLESSSAGTRARARMPRP